MNNKEVKVDENTDRGICEDNRGINSSNKGMGEEGYDTSDPSSVRSAIIQRAELERSSKPKLDISERYGYIYLTENLINGKLYIGQHKFVNKSGIDSDYIGSGVMLYRAIDKYGRDNFKCTLLEYCSSSEELNEREKYWISLFDGTKSSLFYNIADGGYGFPWEGKSEEELNDIKRRISKTLKEYYSYHDVVNKGVPIPEEVRAKVSLALSGENNPNYGKPRSEETKSKISKAHIGMKVSEETKEKLRKAKLGTKHSEESKKKIREALTGSKNPFYGKHHTEETIELIKRNMPDMSGERNAFYGKHHTEELKKYCSEVNKGRKIDKEVMRFRNIPIRCVETGDVFSSANSVVKNLFGTEGYENKRYRVRLKLKESAKYMYETGEYGEEVLGYHWCYTGERKVD